MDILLTGAAWCLAHFLAFLCLRGRLRGERAILLFHAGSFVSFAGLTAVLATSGRADLFPALGAVTAHAIYSLTFLELWSLSEGGYTIALTRSLLDGPAARPEIEAVLARIGEHKRESRIAALTAGGMIERDGDRLCLTPKGGKLWRGLAALRAIANVRAPG